MLSAESVWAFLDLWQHIPTSLHMTFSMSVSVCTLSILFMRTSVILE
uniref:Macaca fascicularis brain cDNA, clone: QmoA-12201 n=1 Tax=Macaca fascicularis TaxID=9541 RepID=I7GEC6_MACFA|nr:unnamed protein product [Macaca fascicularis]